MRMGSFCSLLYLPSSSVLESILLNSALGKCASMWEAAGSLQNT